MTAQGSSSPRKYRVTNKRISTDKCAGPKYACRVGDRRFYFKPDRTRLGKTAKVNRINLDSFERKARAGLDNQVGRVQTVTDNVIATVLKSTKIKEKTLSIIECKVDLPVSQISMEEQNVGGSLYTTPGLYKVENKRLKLGIINLADEPELMRRGTSISGASCQNGQMTQREAYESLAAMHREEDQEPSQDSSGIHEVNMQKLFDELGIEKSELLSQHPGVKKKLKQEIYRLRTVFLEHPDEVGYTDLVQCEIRLKPGTRPIRQKDRPLNPALEADLKKQLSTWLKQGVVEVSKSPWSSPLVPVKKKTGEIRWACDLRLVN